MRKGGREICILKSCSTHLLLLSLFASPNFASDAAPIYSAHACSDDGSHYRPNTTYQTNLNVLLSSLVSNATLHDGFYRTNVSLGTSNEVKGVFLCRGDVTPSLCHDCVAAAAENITRLCTNQTQSVIWYDQCMLRYSNNSVLDNIVPSVGVKNVQSVPDSDLTRFNDFLASMLNDAKQEAVNSASGKKFATKEANFTNSMKLYTLAQCTPDLSTSDCDMCFSSAIGGLPNCCDGKRGARVLLPGCNVRYELYPFYNVSTVSDFPSRSSGKSNRSQVVIATVVPIVSSVGLLIFICIYLRTRKPTNHLGSESKVDEEIKQAESFQFDFDTIRVATNNFSDANKLGQGGFGPVYKGMLFNEQEVAVKRLSSNSGQGDIEFKNEVLLMSWLQHRNLVRLLGFCFERKERLLVYEFLPNRSLDKIIYDPIQRAHLDWKKRYKIIEGIALGLLYLHEDSQKRIIHRDLKLSNILLDADMNPKISDFGLARLFDVDQTQVNASKIAGTLGYMAPEYARHGKFSVKSDVFSFGVMILEIVSGQKNSGFRNGDNVEHLLSFAWKNWKKGAASNIIDPTLNDDLRDEIVRCILIGLLCVQERVVDRPTLASVVLMLDSCSFNLPVPLKPAYFLNDGCISDNQVSECISEETGSNEQNNYADASANEASISSLYPR